MRRAIWAAAAVVLAVTACSGTPAPAPARSAAPSTLAAYYAQHLNWQPCDAGFECAQFVVPFDYAKPDGPRFTLPVVKLPAADPAHQVGTLVINPGGPGGSGVQYALGARQEFPAAVLARFDIVGFDPRGAGASQPALNCENGPQLDTFLATDDEPSDPARLARVVAASKQFAARCERNSAALLPYVGTPNAARDMDVLRAALGESRLTYLGKSYGTYLGAWYAQLFPHRVRALVLDGSVDPATSALDATIAQVQGFQGGVRVVRGVVPDRARLPARELGGRRGGQGRGADLPGQLRPLGQPAGRRAGRRRRDAALRRGRRPVQPVELAPLEDRAG